METTKFIAIVLEGELLTVTPSEGVTQITSSLSSVYVDTKENLTTLLTALGIEDLSKLEEAQPPQKIEDIEDAVIIED